MKNLIIFFGLVFGFNAYAGGDVNLVGSSWYGVNGTSGTMEIGNDSTAIKLANSEIKISSALDVWDNEGELVFRNGAKEFFEVVDKTGKTKKQFQMVMVTGFVMEGDLIELSVLRLKLDGQSKVAVNENYTFKKR